MFFHQNEPIFNFFLRERENFLPTPKKIQLFPSFFFSALYHKFRIYDLLFKILFTTTFFILFVTLL